MRMFNSVEVIRRAVVLALCLAAPSGAADKAGARGPAGRQSGELRDAQPLTTLAAGVPVERELAQGERHGYQLALAEGQYFKIIIKQFDLSVRVSLAQPDGESYFVIDIPQRTPEVVVERVAESSGLYRLDVIARTKAPTGQYEIRVVEVRPATADEGALQQARDLFRRQLALNREGKYAEALPLMTRVLEIRERVLGPESLEVAETMGFLAADYTLVGDYAGAELLQLRVLEIKRKAFGPDAPEVASETRSLGVLYYNKGDYLKAEEMLRKALSIFAAARQTENLTVASSYTYLGNIYDDRGDYEKAEDFYRRSLAVREKLFGPNHFHLAASYASIGRVAYAAGDYAKAEQMFGRALALAEQSLGQDNPGLSGYRNDIAAAYVAGGDYTKAEAQYRQALSAHERLGAMSSPAVQETLYGLARLSAARGAVPDAVKFDARAGELEERYVGLNLAAGSERQKLALLATMSERTDQVISLNMQLAPGDRDAASLAALTLLRRKGRALDAMADTFNVLRRRSGPQDGALLDQLSEVTSRLARLLLNGPQAASPEEHQRAVKALEEWKEELEAEISRRSAEFRTQSRPVTLEAVEAATPTHAALVEFVSYRPFDPKARGAGKGFGEARYAVYVLRGRGAVQGKDLGAAKEIDAAVEALRQALRDPARSDVRRLARAVDEKVMRPVRALAGDAAQLLVSPDGALNLIPFEALVDEGGKYLVERYSFSYLTSGRDLLRFQTAGVSRGGPVVLADPAFGEPAVVAAGGGARQGAGARVRFDYSQFFFGPLPGVGAEVRALKGLLPQATFLTGEQATKAALKRVRGPIILHIATHGFFLTDDARAGGRPPSRPDGATRVGGPTSRVENPLLRSGLALAGANRGIGGDDDGVLTAFEIARLDLWGTKLVVLSACDTGLGEVRRGDGVYGLRRAFVLAGAESQLMSLWPVSDRGTRDLMVSYYKSLMGGEGRGEALRGARLQLLRSRARSHPYYWAGFIQTGDWANLKGER
jgi:CHAT domain-containing protein